MVLINSFPCHLHQCSVYPSYIRYSCHFLSEDAPNTEKAEKGLVCIFDLSQESVNLAKDICKSSNEGKDFRIVFVKTPMEDSHLERFSFSHILSFADNRNETIEELMEINALLTYSRKSITIGMDDTEWEEAIGLNILRRYIKSIQKIYTSSASLQMKRTISTRQ